MNLERRDIRTAHFASLRGSGIEIGPLANPAMLRAGATVRYVDQFGLDELRRRNPDVPAEAVVAPDVIADSHALAPIADASVDFVIASHVLEHLDNPVAALLEWRRVLRPRGRLVLVVPDGRFTFDAGRALTSLEHILWDYVNAGSELKRLSDLFHIAECNLNLHEHLTVDTSVELAQRILVETYDTHFHVWSFDALHTQLRRLIGFGLPFSVSAAESDGQAEMVFVLTATRKRGAFDPGPAVPGAGR
jgi:SAM-dependent methyltransferase